MTSPATHLPPAGGSDASSLPTDVSDTGWYVLRCKPREDARALRELGNQGFETFAPTCSVMRRRGTTRRASIEPLFPGYVFVQLNSTRHNWGVLRSTRGVIGMVRFGMNAPRVPEAVIDALRKLDGLELDARARAGLKAGDRIEVLDGPFAGLQGVFQHTDGEARAMVLLDCMQRMTRVVLPAESIAAVT
jgi:transcriptional antiterminator RfaH